MQVQMLMGSPESRSPEHQGACDRLLAWRGDVAVKMLMTFLNDFKTKLHIFIKAKWSVH